MTNARHRLIRGGKLPTWRDGGDDRGCQSVLPAINSSRRSQRTRALKWWKLVQPDGQISTTTTWFAGEATYLAHRKADVSTTCENRKDQQNNVAEP